MIRHIVLYRSRTDEYTVAPAIITATTKTLTGSGEIPPLTDENHVHLTVFTPQIPQPVDQAERQQNVAGEYQEFDVPRDDTGTIPGTWSW